MTVRERPGNGITDVELSFYLQPFSRYWALSIVGSRPWPYMVTWYNQSRDHSTRHRPFPIGGPLEPSTYLL